jgi:pimeloyl-ACP methyl ester carboxylesterase
MRELAVSQGRADGTSLEDFDLAEYFLHDVAPDVVQESARHQRDQADKPFGEPWPLSSWPDVPTRVLTGRDDRFFPADFQRRLAGERLGLSIELVPGGHLAAMAHPVQIADLLEACSDQVIGAAGAR